MVVLGQRIIGLVIRLTVTHKGSFLFNRVEAGICFTFVTVGSGSAWVCVWAEMFMCWVFMCGVCG